MAVMCSTHNICSKKLLVVTIRLLASVISSPVAIGTDSSGRLSVRDLSFRLWWAWHDFRGPARMRSLICFASVK